MGNVIEKMNTQLNKLINSFALGVIPDDRIIKIMNHQLYISTFKFKLDGKRKLLETLCVLDLLRHEREHKGIFGPSMYTVVAEESYFDALCMIDHLHIHTSIIYQALNKYPEHVKITSNALKAYCPTSQYIYISFVNHNY